MTRFLACLDTMWSDRAGVAPDFFAISEHNFSGRRLYTLTGEDPGCLWCTNCCPELVTHPDQHGTPSVERLGRCLARWVELTDKHLARGTYSGATILVCGRVSQATFGKLASPPPYRRVYLPHPAARNWTKEGLRRAAQFIQEGRSNLRLEIVKGVLRAKVLETEVVV